MFIFPKLTDFFVNWIPEVPATMPANDITVTAKFNVSPQDKETPGIVMVTPENS